MATYLLRSVAGGGGLRTMLTIADATRCPLRSLGNGAWGPKSLDTQALAAPVGIFVSNEGSMGWAKSAIGL